MKRKRKPAAAKPDKSDAGAPPPTRGAYKEALKDPFLAEFKKKWTISGACGVMNVSRETVNEWRRTDPAFAAAFDSANADITESLESKGYSMALASDAQMVKFFLEARAPDVYRAKFKGEFDIKVADAIVADVLAAIKRHATPEVQAKIAKDLEQLPERLQLKKA